MVGITIQEVCIRQPVSFRSCSRTSRLLSSPERRNLLRCCLRVLVIALVLVVVVVNEVGVGFELADQRAGLIKETSR